MEMETEGSEEMQWRRRQERERGAERRVKQGKSGNGDERKREAKREWNGYNTSGIEGWNEHGVDRREY